MRALSTPFRMDAAVITWLTIAMKRSKFPLTSNSITLIYVLRRPISRTPFPVVSFPTILYSSPRLCPSPQPSFLVHSPCQTNSPIPFTNLWRMLTFQPWPLASGLTSQLTRTTPVRLSPHRLRVRLVLVAPHGVPLVPLSITPSLHRPNVFTADRLLLWTTPAA